MLILKKTQQTTTKVGKITQQEVKYCQNEIAATPPKCQELIWVRLLYLFQCRIIAHMLLLLMSYVFSKTDADVENYKYFLQWSMVVHV